MSESFIFKDREKLSPYYIPSLLPYRDEQISLLRSIYGKKLRNVKSVYPRFTQIVGGKGTGKTSTTIRFGGLICREAESEGVNLKHVYLNCMVDGTTRYVLYGKLVKKVNPKLSTRSLSPEEMLSQLVDHLRDEGRFLLVSFDEIDYFVTSNPKERIVYDVTRIPEMHPGEPSPIIGGIFISRSLKWHERLEPEEKSTLGMSVIEFSRYTGEQIREILELRVEEAFNPRVVSDEALNLISDITASPPVNGDVRVGLDLLYLSGNLAENLGAERLMPDHVRRVQGEINPTLASEDIESLDENGKLILLALVRSLQFNKSAYVGLRELRESYSLVCEEFNIKPVEEFEDYVQDLIYRGIVDMKSLKHLGISGASLTDLERYLNSLTKRLRRRLNED